MNMKKLFAVITCTEEGVDLAGLYDNIGAAKEHVSARFAHELSNFAERGVNVGELDVCTAPSDYGAEITYGDEYWRWQIQCAEVRSESLVGKRNRGNI